MGVMNNVFVNFGVDEDDIVSVSVEGLSKFKYMYWFMDGGIEDKNNGNGWMVEEVLEEVKKWVNDEKVRIGGMGGVDKEYVDGFGLKLDNCFKVFEEKLNELLEKGFGVMGCKGWSIEYDNNWGVLLVNYDEVEVEESVFINDVDKDNEEE